MSVGLDVADAVLAELQAGCDSGSLAGGSFSQAFTPHRRVLPSFDLSDLTTLRVTVVPKSLTTAPFTRAVREHVVQVDVGVQKRVGADDDADVVTLCDLMEEIADYLYGRVLTDYEGAKWQAQVVEPIYALEHLTLDRTFTSVLTLTYVVLR